MERLADDKVTLRSKARTLSTKAKLMVKSTVNLFKTAPTIIEDKLTVSALRRKGIEVNSVNDLYSKLYLNELSGAHNRRCLNDKIKREIELSKGPVSVVYFDGDNLKYINDNYGHDAGDREIEFLSQTIAKHFNCGKNDIPNPASLGKNVRFVHISGDEFMIIFFNTPYDEVIKKIVDIKQDINTEALKRKKEKLHIIHQTGVDPLIPPPLSFTSAIVNKNDGDTFDNMETRLDQILNEIKQHDKGSIYFENSKIWGNYLTRIDSFEQIRKLVNQYRGKNNYFLACNFDYLDKSLDRTNKINSHTIDAVKQLDELIIEKFQNCKVNCRINDMRSIIILTDADKDTFDQLTQLINETINLDNDLYDKVSFNVGGQEMLDNYSAEQIVVSAEEKLRLAQNTCQDVLIDRRMTINL